MTQTLRFSFLYFLSVFAVGFVLGTIRVIVMIPRFGKLTSVTLEIPFMLLASWILCRRLLRYFFATFDSSHKSPPPHPLLLGFLAFLFLIISEFLLTTTAFEQSPTDFIQHFATVPGTLGLSAQIGFGLMPWIQVRVLSLKS